MQNSNTTNVKVKRDYTRRKKGRLNNSNTTNVKVKLTETINEILTPIEFKYNQC